MGEPLIELRCADDGELGVAFGGDVANSMVCLRRILDVDDYYFSLVTALGDSAYSAWLRNKLTREGIHVIEYAVRGEPGIYGISPDLIHHPSSSYWRAESAARRFFQSAQLSEFAGLLREPELLIVTGITLALCSAAGFESLCQWVELHRMRCHVVFDCNFRPALWASAEQARQRIGRFERLAALTATGLEDEKLLWGAADATAVMERLTAHLNGWTGEHVLRGGRQGCWVGTHQVWTHVPAAPVVTIDPVGAGDAHLAGYLAARIVGSTAVEAASFANRVAAVIVRQQGSIPADNAVFPMLPIRPQ